MGELVDLHTHTYYSDSTVSPEELVELAKTFSLRAIAITDHDTLDGYIEALEFREKYGVEVYPGVELSTDMDGTDIHILGYLVDPYEMRLQNYLATFRKAREERAYKIVENLKSMGVNISIKRVFEIAGKGSVGRPHIARVLYEEGYVSSLKEAFEKYIGYDSPAYVPKFKISIKDGIKLILDSGGVPVLAHPGHYNFSEETLWELWKSGLLGLEVWHPDHKQEDVERFTEICKKIGFIMTGGSDFHGARKPHIKFGSIKVSYEILQTLKNYSKNNF